MPESAAGHGGELPADRWDAGDMGCGELIVKLRGRMRRLEPGQIFELIEGTTVVGGAKLVELLAQGTPHVSY
ncbi:hypothetical protein AADG42_01135 [Ammonicoccus fulvus]|uniref:Sulfurtransferase TusA family protein n=1 Tax=Ammonicoccus fulvus TaxID=3138240 RepID=A0ABZ3FJ18_9ACTN